MDVQPGLSRNADANDDQKTDHQGVILGGLMNMYLLTEDDELLEVAANIANATTSLLVYPNGKASE